MNTPSRTPGRRSLRAIMVVYVILQVVLPVWGLYVANETGHTRPFSWYMFSRLAPGDEDGSRDTSPR